MDLKIYASEEYVDNKISEISNDLNFEKKYLGIENANVGQIIQVAETDADGQPITYVAVDMPSDDSGSIVTIKTWTASDMVWGGAD